ncbi:hypothetical protein [Ferviditalea candida]|uniref:Uncharacterized protein n=1 Tax=Ferviditalea candida TaxID=3108399 RepID=A0ABU5ZEL3_9BACL|nr:hypothetical protein [Paenibacillaceae bacterium T2]
MKWELPLFPLYLKRLLIKIKDDDAVYSKNFGGLKHEQTDLSLCGA